MQGAVLFPNKAERLCVPPQKGILYKEGNQAHNNGAFAAPGSQIFREAQNITDRDFPDEESGEFFYPAIASTIRIISCFPECVRSCPGGFGGKLKTGRRYPFGRMNEIESVL